MKPSIFLPTAILIGVAVACFASAAYADGAPAAISLNDVSMLLPIPKTAEEMSANYLTGSTMLASGALVNSANLKLFDWSVTGADIDLRKRENVDRLVVLGIRMDPCFKDLFTDACRPQIRLVAQEAVFASGKPASTADVGVHLFFDTTEAQVVSLIRFAADYRTKFLGAGSARAPLQVQPVVNQEGVSGKFWQAFRPMLLDVIGKAKPSRMAFFTVLPTERDWIFRSFDFIDGKARPIDIPGIKNEIQPIDNQAASSSAEFTSTKSNLPRSAAGTDQTFDFLRDSAEFRRSGESRTRPLQVTLERLENPKVHLPGTIDCLSCHSTAAIKTNLRKKGVTLGPNEGSFVAKVLPAMSLFNLNETHFEARDFRLFGYRNGSAVVGQRVINESAAIVDSLTPAASAAVGK